MITFHNGDLLKSGCDIICHQVNEYGVMGAGLARQIADKYPLCEKKYIENYSNYMPGDVLYWFGKPVIANCFSQTQGKTDYEAVKACFSKIKAYVRETHYLTTVGVPFNYGCGIADGKWEKVFTIFEEIFKNDKNIDFQVWKYEEEL